MPNIAHGALEDRLTAIMQADVQRIAQKYDVDVGAATRPEIRIAVRAMNKMTMDLGLTDKNIVEVYTDQTALAHAHNILNCVSRGWRAGAIEDVGRLDKTGKMQPETLVALRLALSDLS